MPATAPAWGVSTPRPATRHATNPVPRVERILANVLGDFNCINLDPSATESNGISANASGCHEFAIHSSSVPDANPHVWEAICN